MRLLPHIWDNILPVLIGLLLAYMIGAFVGTSFDPTNWTFELRAFMSIAGVCAGLALWCRMYIGGAYE
jgi:phage shock protein PspC (stress-responsive transcriptional regulator)